MLADAGASLADLEVTVWLLTLGIGSALCAAALTAPGEFFSARNTPLSRANMDPTIRDPDIDQVIEVRPLPIAPGTHHVRCQIGVMV